MPTTFFRNFILLTCCLTHCSVTIKLVLVFLILRSGTFIGAVFLLVGRRLKISGSVDVDACGGGGDGVGLGETLSDRRDSETTRILFAVME